MKKRILFFATLFLAFAVSLFHLVADGTSGQKEITKKLTDEIHARPMTEKDYTAMCQRIMNDMRAKRKMCELIAQDPEAMAMLRTRK